MKIYKGAIISCDPEDSVFQYLMEKDGKIECTGNDIPETFRHLPVVDLGQKALIPAFTDSHLHFTSYSLFSSTLDVREAVNFSHLSEIIRRYIEETNSRVVFGFGISAHSVEEQRMITRKELDGIEKIRPVMLVKYDGHACVANSAMLNMLPLSIKNLRGYHAESGQLFHEAFFKAVDFISSKVSPMALMKHMLRAVDKMAEKGIGLVHPAEGVGFPLDLDVDLVRFMARGLVNPFAFRVFFQTMNVKKVLRRRLPRIGGCFATALDGCFGSLDAALSRSYENDPGNMGILFYEDKPLLDFVQKAHDNGLQVQLHAIGDEAFDQAARVFQTALKNNPRRDHRHSIIHALLTTPEGLDICARHQIGIAAQPSLLHQNLEPLSYLKKILGKRAFDISPFRTMLDMGIHVSGGSDAPVTLPDPAFGIFCACNHYQEDQAISITEAIKMFTLETAWAGFDDTDRGSLEPGKKADMVVLSENPLKMKKQDLARLKTETLYLGGIPYQKGQGVGSLLFRALLKPQRS